LSTLGGGPYDHPCFIFIIVFVYPEFSKWKLRAIIKVSKSAQLVLQSYANWISKKKKKKNQIKNQS